MHLAKHITSLSSFCDYWNLMTELRPKRLSHLSKVTQLGGGQGRIWTQAYRAAKDMLFALGRPAWLWKGEDAPAWRPTWWRVPRLVLLNHWEQHPHQVQHGETGRWQHMTLLALPTHGVNCDSCHPGKWGNFPSPAGSSLFHPQQTSPLKNLSAHQNSAAINSLNKYLQSPKLYTWS